MTDNAKTSLVFGKRSNLFYDGTLYLLFLAVCTVFFSVKSEAIKDRFLINFADRIDNTALGSSYLITTLAFIALGTLIMQQVF